MIVRFSLQSMWKSLWASSPQVGMGICASWWLWGLVAPGLGRLKPDTTGSCHGGRPASDFSTFNIIYILSLGVKVQSYAHYSSKDNFPLSIARKKPKEQRHHTIKRHSSDNTDTPLHISHSFSTIISHFDPRSHSFKVSEVESSGIGQEIVL